MASTGNGETYDVVVVGASIAGLSAALMLGRARWRVLVLDGGEPRNAPADGVHYFLTRDGTPPAELLRIARQQLQPYPDVELRQAMAVGASGAAGRFEVALADGSTARARRLVLATGVQDELPERPGFRELWGRGVYHCPYCHGWEVRDRPLAVLAKPEELVARAAFIRHWSRDLVALTDGEAIPEGDVRATLARLEVPLREARVARLEGDGEARVLRRIVFGDGSAIERQGLFYGPPQRQRSDLAASLGCEIGPQGPLPAVVSCHPLTRETTVPGVYVAGDAGTMSQQAIVAAAHGAMAAGALSNALIAADAGVAFPGPPAPRP